MKTMFSALLGLAALHDLAAGRSSPVRIAYAACYAVGWDEYICDLVAGGSVVVSASGRAAVWLI